MSQSHRSKKSRTKRLTELSPAPVGPITLMVNMVSSEKTHSLRKTYAITMSFLSMEPEELALDGSSRATEYSWMLEPGESLECGRLKADVRGVSGW